MRVYSLVIVFICHTPRAAVGAPRGIFSSAYLKGRAEGFGPSGCTFEPCRVDEGDKMMSMLNLFWIVPLCVAIGYAIACMMWMASDKREDA